MPFAPTANVIIECIQNKVETCSQPTRQQVKKPKFGNTQNNLLISAPAPRWN